MATHSSILAWKIPWMEEPGRLQSMGSQRAGSNWVTSLHSLARLIGGNNHHARIPPGLPSGSVVKNLPVVQETQVQSLDQEDPLQKEMATHSSIFAWEIPWTEEPGRATVHGMAKSDTTEQLNNKNNEYHQHQWAEGQSYIKFSDKLSGLKRAVFYDECM